MAWTKEQRNEYSRMWAKNNKARRARYARNWRAKNPEKAKEAEAKSKLKYGSEYYRVAKRKQNPRTVKNTALRNTLGITVDEYERMERIQHGLCACCGEAEWRTASNSRHTGKILALCVDHDHATGDIRDLLCGSCNSAIGMLRERVWVAERVVAYLKRWGK